MKTVLKVIGVLVVALAVVFGASALLEQAGIETPLTAAKNGAANAALEASGIKAKADEVLRSNAGKISQKTGLPVSAVESAIDSLDIPSWQVTTLPADATATGSSTINYNGTTATLTTYDDPSVVTVTTGGVDVTLEVPASAQGYMQYLGYL